MSFENATAANLQSFSDHRNVRLLYLIPPYFTVDELRSEDNTVSAPVFTIPYGILSLDAYIKGNCRNSVTSKVVDFNAILRNEMEKDVNVDADAIFSEIIEKTLAEFKPDIVAISVLFSVTYRFLKLFSNLVKRYAPEAIQLTGGGMPSAGYNLVLSDCPSIDAVCRGEGELPLATLIDSDDREALLASHNSWITREKLSPEFQPEHCFIEDLDEIPVFDYSIVDLKEYNTRSLDKRHKDKNKREMAIHTSRGCPFLCVFCSNPALHGRDVRTMSVDRVIKEVELMKKEQGLTILMIEDDHFFHDINRAKEILRRLAELDIRIEFPNGVAVYAIDDEVAELFARAGVSTVALAVESGSSFVLNRIIKKPLKVSLIREKVAALRKYDILIHAFIIIGFPGETDEHREETHQLLLHEEFDWAHIYCAMPIIGSRLYDICVENNYLDNSDPSQNIIYKSSIRAPGVDPKKIEERAYFLNLSVNFVHNYNVRIGNYEKAIHYFKNVRDKYPGHAFSRYFYAKCLEATGGDQELIHEEYAQFSTICESDPFWLNYAETFNLLEAKLSA